MTLNEATEAIYLQFATGWAASSYSAIPYRFENESNVEGESGWLRVSVRELDSRQETMASPGDRRFRRTGVIQVQIFAPIDQGAKTSNLWAEQVRTIFEGVSFGDGVNSYSSAVRFVGADERWHNVLSESFFEYHSIK